MLIATLVMLLTSERSNNKQEPPPEPWLTRPRANVSAWTDMLRLTQLSQLARNAVITSRPAPSAQLELKQSLTVYPLSSRLETLVSLRNSQQLLDSSGTQSDLNTTLAMLLARPALLLELTNASPVPTEMLNGSNQPHPPLTTTLIYKLLLILMVPATLNAPLVNRLMQRERLAPLQGLPLDCLEFSQSF